MLENIDFKIIPNMNLWLDIQSDFEFRILTGEMVLENNLVPSISTLSNVYQCAEVTAFKVLGSLQKEGVLSNKKGVGCTLTSNYREILLNKHSVETEKRIAASVSFALRCGYNEDQIKELVSRAFNKTKKYCGKTILHVSRDVFLSYAQNDNRLFEIEKEVYNYANSLKENNQCSVKSFRLLFDTELRNCVGLHAKVSALRSSTAYDIVYNYLLGILPGCEKC